MEKIGSRTRSCEVLVDVCCDVQRRETGNGNNIYVLHFLLRRDSDGATRSYSASNLAQRPRDGADTIILRVNKGKDDRYETLIGLASNEKTSLRSKKKDVA